jgi:hypothetical protein
MSRGLTLTLLFTPILGGGCLINPGKYQERMDSFEEQAKVGAWGVYLRDRPDCIQVDMGGLALDGAWSFEAYLQPEVRDGFVSPIVVWPGAFAFLQDATGYLIATPASNPVPSAGASTPTSLMDGGRHHVALNHTSEGVVSIYLDGELKSSAPVTFDANPEGTLELGCWSGEGETFVGILGEVRISAAALYAGSFEVPWEPYEVEQATLALWHIDEGEGTGIGDATESYPGVLVGGSWTRFNLSSE